MEHTKRSIKGLLALLCAILLCLSLGLLVGCGQQQKTDTAKQDTAKTETVKFTDSVGREVELPKNIERICPSGFTSQQVLLTIAPEKLVGLAQELTADQKKIFGSSFDSKPVFGAVLGATDTLNREEVAKADPQVIIDTGQAKSGIKEDLDALQEQLGIPVIFIESSLENYEDAYKTLGEVLGVQSRGNEIGDYLGTAYKTVEDVMATIPEADRTSIAYIVSKDGLNAIAKTSFQGQVVDMVANNVVVVDDVSGKGTGNQISMEQMSIWDPEIMIFQDETLYNSVASDPSWSGLTAIATGNYYLCPSNPWCWLNNPPTVNQMMGMEWLPRLLYPNKFDDTIQDVTKSYYKTLYNYDLSESELNDLLSDSMPK